MINLIVPCPHNSIGNYVYIVQARIPENGSNTIKWLKTDFYQSNLISACYMSFCYANTNYINIYVKVHSAIARISSSKSKTKIGQFSAAVNIAD